MEQQPRRFFTVDEANALLPEIEPLVRRLQRLGQELSEVRSRLSAWQWKARANGHIGLADLEADTRLARQLTEEVQALVERIQAFGCEVKDLEMGLVDFPALRKGRPVYLCWRLGEPRVAYWHELETGFAGRRPIDW